MSVASPVYPDTPTPTQDGEVLLWPEPAELPGLTFENQRKLSTAKIKVQRIPLAEVRQAQREWIGQKEPQRSLIVSAHQIELYHPGVWVKDVLINALAAKMGGLAYHFAVDTDAPKHLQLRWPGGAMPITDDPRLTTVAFAAALDAPTPAHLARLTSELDAAAKQWPFVPLIGDFLASIRRLWLEQKSLTWVLTNAVHELDWSLGLRHHSMLASPIWNSPGFLLFAHHLLAHADRFATVYNAVLGWYRYEKMIRAQGRPWPDLRQEAEIIESPFWADSLATGQRERAFVVKGEQFWVLKIGEHLFEVDPYLDGWEASQKLGRFLADHQLRLSPRALPLTMFLRLFLADNFIHGTGGGRYDQITDHVIQTFFGIDPPSYAVTTATLLFPTAAGQDRVNIPAMELQGRRLRHLWADPRKRSMAREIDQLPRRSPKRAQLFYQMHELLDAQLREPSYRQWENRLAELKSTGQAQRDIFDRELFFALQPADRLKMLIEEYDARLS